MRNPMKNPLAGLMAAVAALSIGTGGTALAADAFPSKPVTMLVAFPPGGPADVLARAMQPSMAKALGQPLVIENLPGAGGALAVQRLLSRPADGYTLIMGSPNEAILAPLANASAKYKPEELALLAPISTHPLVVMARQRPAVHIARTAHRREQEAGQPGLTFGSPGHGSMYHIVSEYMAQTTGAKLLHVPYKGATPMMQDLAGRQIDITILPNLGASTQLLESRKIKAINVLDTQRMARCPTCRRSPNRGIAQKTELVHSIWLAVMSKAGIPADRLRVLMEASQQAIQSPEMAKALEPAGVQAMKPQSLEASARFYADETAKFRKMAHSIKLSRSDREAEKVHMNILVAGFQHETNTFAPTMASYESFVRGEDFPALARGDEIFGLLNVNIPISGFIRLRARARPQRHARHLGRRGRVGPRDHRCLRAHRRRDRAGGEDERLRRHLPGPARRDGHRAPGRRRRRAAGAHPRDRRCADEDRGLARFACQRHHADARAGRRPRRLPHAIRTSTWPIPAAGPASCCWRIAASGRPLHREVRRLPFLIPVNSMSTMMQPARGVYDLLEELETTGVLSLSFAPGFPASDFAECGPVVWGYGFDPARIAQAVETLFARVAQPEAQWAVQFDEPEAAVRHAMRVAETASRPVILADTQDNPGVGGDSNTTGLLRTLLKLGARDAAIGLICDPAAAAAAHAAGVGAQIDVALGGCPQVEGDEPLRARCVVEALSDGRFVYGGPMMHGKEADLGPMARLRIDGVRIAVSSAKAQLLDRNMYRTVGIEPEKMKILVNKSSVHFRADFAAIAEEILVVRAPGPFIADPADLPWKQLGEGMRTRPNGPAFSSSGARCET